MGYDVDKFAEKVKDIEAGFKKNVETSTDSEFRKKVLLENVHDMAIAEQGTVAIMQSVAQIESKHPGLAAEIFNSALDGMLAFVKKSERREVVNKAVTRINENEDVLKELVKKHKSTKKGD